MDDVTQSWRWSAFLEFQTRKKDSSKINLQVEDRWTRNRQMINSCLWQSQLVISKKITYFRQDQCDLLRGTRKWGLLCTGGQFHLIHSKLQYEITPPQRPTLSSPLQCPPTPICQIRRKRGSVLPLEFSTEFLKMDKGLSRPTWSCEHSKCMKKQTFGFRKT